MTVIQHQSPHCVFTAFSLRFHCVFTAFSLRSHCVPYCVSHCVLLSRHVLRNRPSTFVSLTGYPRAHSHIKSYDSAIRHRLTRQPHTHNQLHSRHSLNRAFARSTQSFADRVHRIQSRSVTLAQSRVLCWCVFCSLESSSCQ